MSLYDGLKIGLFGGSFNPAHSGHMHVADTALVQLGLDRIWWMVSPQNPLKPAQPSYDTRVASVHALDLKPRMEISHLEVKYGTQYTIDMIKTAQKRFPRTGFVFLMGADNFLQLPKWRAWKDIVERVPIAIISRPNPVQKYQTLRARTGKAAQMYRRSRIAESHASALKYCRAPAWIYLTPPMNSLSSSQIRAADLHG